MTNATEAPGSGNSPKDDRKESCFHIRDEIERIKVQVASLRIRPDLCAIPECGANITLAYRHLEDARMRMGKAIQGLDDGVDVYQR